jgi:hypothetical protein
VTRPRCASREEGFSENEPQAPERKALADSTEANRSRLSDRTVLILLAISIVALVLWWTRHFFLPHAL